MKVNSPSLTATRTIMVTIPLRMKGQLPVTDGYFERYDDFVCETVSFVFTYGLV
jgi:hypothetical protein